MTYLEKMIKLKLEDRNLFLVEGTFESAAQYIEQQNENADSDTLYSVEDWIRDTLQNYPTSLVKVSTLLSKVSDYFIKQEAMCLDQTGRLPNMEDYIGAAESEEFRDIVGYPITLETYFRALMKYYMENSCL